MFRRALEVVGEEGEPRGAFDGVDCTKEKKIAREQGAMWAYRHVNIKKRTSGACGCVSWRRCRKKEKTDGTK